MVTRHFHNRPTNICKKRLELALCNAELDEIKERRSRITQFPWYWNSYSTIFAVDPNPTAPSSDLALDDEGNIIICWFANKPGTSGDELHSKEAQANAYFVEHAPDDIDNLIKQTEWFKETLQLSDYDNDSLNATLAMNKYWFELMTMQVNRNWFTRLLSSWIFDRWPHYMEWYVKTFTFGDK